MKRFLLAGTMLLALAAPATALQLTSTELHEGGQVPLEQVYTRCGGQNVSPGLAWSGAPAGTKSFAVTAIDLDVHPNEWSHWIVVGLPPGTASLAKGASVPAGSQALMTDFGDAGYAGPCPPKGSGVHHYQFTVWALRTPTIQFAPHSTAADVQATLEKTALAKATITASYQR
jgi:hypothetical protein